MKKKKIIQIVVIMWKNNESTVVFLLSNIVFDTIVESCTFNLPCLPCIERF